MTTSNTHATPPERTFKSVTGIEVTFNGPTKVCDWCNGQGKRIYASPRYARDDVLDTCDSCAGFGVIKDKERAALDAALEEPTS